MFEVKFSVFEDSELLPKVMANIVKLKDEFDKQNASISMRHENVAWQFVLKHIVISRNEKEMNAIFGEAHKFNLLSALLEVDIHLIEKTRTRFTLGSVVPVTELDFLVPDGLEKDLGAIEFNFDPTNTLSSYLKNFQLETLKPWETMKELMCRQSESTQGRIFKDVIRKVPPSQARTFLDLPEDERLDYFRNVILTPDVQPFFEHFLEDKNIPLETIIENLKLLVVYHDNLDKIYEVKEGTY